MEKVHLLAVLHIKILVLLCIAFTSCSRSDNQVNKPNIILIMADDLGYGELSCYGSTKIHTPNIDQLAAQGVRLTDYHSNGPVCSPTRAALMTGKYQQRTGVEGVITAANHRDVGLSLVGGNVVVLRTSYFKISTVLVLLVITRDILVLLILHPVLHH